MKFLLIVSIACILTGSLKQPQQLEDSIENSKIKISNRNQNIYSLGSQYELKKTMGDIKGIKGKDEILGGPACTYKYNGLKVYFIKQRFESAMITNPSYFILLAGATFSVGDQIDKFKRYFPRSYKSASKGDNLVIYITNHKTMTDAYISFAINKMGYVTSIWIGNDHS
ncbi:hypothetical protein [uncultured Mucilaginibacter sp.]|uniref:hypothetical protein n=1 Tax=uncultured Mucilaginibacter sp. TaxID=797541 RepID=UPI0025CE524C|nr:hypothetical protein [uncultured Mucilaginibacter sp.]